MGPPRRTTSSDSDIEIAALTDRAMHGRFVLLYAPRRYGKTSLIHRIRRDAHDSNDLAVVLVDFLGVQTIDDLSHRIGQALQSVPAGPFASAVRKLAGRSPEVSAQLGYGPASIQLKRGEQEAPHLLEELLRLPHQVGRRPRLPCAGRHGRIPGRRRCFQR